MGGYELLGRIGVAMFFPGFAEHVLFFGLQHWKLADFLKIFVDAAFTGQDWKVRSHIFPLFTLSPT